MSSGSLVLGSMMIRCDLYGASYCYFFYALLWLLVVFWDISPDELDEGFMGEIPVNSR